MLSSRALVTLLLLTACGGESKKGGGTANSSSSTASNTSDSSASDATSTGPTGSGGTGTTTDAGTSDTTAASGGASAATSQGSLGSTSDGGEAGTGTGGAGGGGTGGLDCPTQPPENGSDCSIDVVGFPAAQCSWGDDPRPECRSQAVCNGGIWTVQEPFSTNCEGPPLPSACSSEPPENGTACDEANLECWYESGTRCTCSPCAGGSGYPVCGQIDPPEWWCSTPQEGCPVPSPQAGTACDDPEASCGLDCALPIVCQEGAWQYGQNGCPICAAPDTPIATPSGEQPIEALRVGDLVYSVENDAIVAVPIARVGSTPVQLHQVLHIVLSSGDTLEMSPGHPTSSGGTLAQLAPGDWLDATHQVVSSTLIPFDAKRTHDILPASESGVYFAAGVLVGSTLAR